MLLPFAVIMSETHTRVLLIARVKRLAIFLMQVFVKLLVNWLSLNVTGSDFKVLQNHCCAYKAG